MFHQVCGFAAYCCGWAVRREHLQMSTEGVELERCGLQRSPLHAESSGPPRSGFPRWSLRLDQARGRSDERYPDDVRKWTGWATAAASTYRNALVRYLPESALA